MEKRYIRNIPAITEAEQTLLAEKTAAVVGCGGLGGYLAEFLCRLGVGCIRVIDGDRFEESNLNRQLLSAPSLLGQNKAEAAAARLRQINPDIAVEVHPVFLTAENAAELLSGCDMALDGLDNISSRKALASAGLPCVFGGIGGWTAQAALSLPGDGLVHRLYPGEAAARDKSALSFTPALCAAVQVSICLRFLLDRPVESGVLYYFDLLGGEFERFFV